ncbi:hypothetical protein [Halolamina rubra]|uniref:hypothetical protein n=1 Tax=Halolamina rubra TaxID=1380430 RepID=UPI0012AC527E|nr:hypothetical protein [Halolamina rubra]
MELTLAQLITIVLGAVVLASTDPAALSRLGMAWLSKKLGVKPRDITKVDNATDGDADE